MGRAQNYTSMADDEVMAKSKREAAMLLSVAEGQLSDGLVKESLEAAEQSLKLFADVQDEAGEADAIDAIIQAQKAQAEADRDQPTNALAFALDKMAAFEQKGQRRG